MSGITYQQHRPNLAAKHERELDAAYVALDAALARFGYDQRIFGKRLGMWTSRLSILCRARHAVWTAMMESGCTPRATAVATGAPITTMHAPDKSKKRPVPSRRDVMAALLECADGPGGAA